MDDEDPSTFRLVHSLRVITINLALSAVVITAAALALRLDGYWSYSLPKQLELLAWPPFLVGALLIIVSAFTLLTRGGASGAPGDPTRRLVTTGPYRYLRNPIYAGVSLTLFGVAFLSRSPTLLLVALVFLPAVHLYVRFVEEPRTEHRFGGEYVSYKQNIPRWIPQPPKKKCSTRQGPG